MFLPGNLALEIKCTPDSSNFLKDNLQRVYSEQYSRQ